MKLKQCYRNLSPFELKNKLIEIAKDNYQCMLLNAGRGNPNWVATEPRQAFFQLGLFALEESQRTFNKSNKLSGIPNKRGIAKRLAAFIRSHSEGPGARLLQSMVRYVQKQLFISMDEFLGEMVNGILGDNYPEPERMLTYSEQILRAYLEKEMCQGKAKLSKVDLFATEGGTGAISNIFVSLMENRLLHKGDKIALGIPIFTPYLEIPQLHHYEFVKLEIQQSETLHWQYPDSEIKKLEDPAIKAFFLVHPSNPTSVSMHPHTLNQIGKLIKTKRKDLIILTDDVYGTFVHDFQSLMSVAPFNTILVYSFSKYFGATGWRLGAIGIHRHNIFDKMIAALPARDQQLLYERYKTVTVNPKKMKLIDRMVADSRAIAFNHTAGLSTPQQVMMALFSLYCLMDRKDAYKKTAQSVVQHRKQILYQALELPYEYSPYDTHYYTIVDLVKLAEIRYGQTFARYLTKHYEPIDWMMNLAAKKSVVLMNGSGFSASLFSVRISLANLPDKAYEAIGHAIIDLLEEYYQLSQRKWCNQKQPPRKT